MISHSYRYQQHSSTLEVEGLPDRSKESHEDTIGILSTWRLRLIGHPLLEGKKEHLDYLMSVILQYSRYSISGIRASFVSPKDTVSIIPLENNLQKLLLRSSQIGIKPIELVLDDSQLADLTRCLDQLRHDLRVDIKWSTPPDLPFSKDKLIDPKLFKNKIALPTLSTILFLSFSFILMTISPVPEQSQFDNLDNQDRIEELD